MSSCEQIPSITIWGTTQITSISSYYSTFTSLVPGDQVTRTATSIVPDTCDDGSDCPSSTSTGVDTITMMKTSVGSSAVETQMVFTSIVPQNTLYYPCSDAFTTTSGSATWQSGSSLPAATQSTQELVSTTSAYPITSPLPTSIVIESGSSTGMSSSASQSSSSAIQSSFQAVPASPTTTMSDSSRSPSGTESSSHSTSSGSSMGTGHSDASQSPSSSGSSNCGAIIGGVVGGIVAMLFLVLLLLCVRRRRAKKQNAPSDQGNDVGDYWERKFRALEAGGAGGSGEGTEKDDWDLKSSRKLHLTLDLASKDIDVTSTRRQSRLSTISSFFASSFAGAVPSRIRSNGGLNFSRPLGPPLLPSEADSASLRSHPKSPRSVKSSKTQHWSAGSRSSRRSNNRLSAFVLPSMREEDELLEDKQQSSTVVGIEGKRVMEWIRQCQFEDGESLPLYMDNEISRGECSKGDTVVIEGPPPPKRPTPARLPLKLHPVALPTSCHSSSQVSKDSTKTDYNRDTRYPSYSGTSAAKSLYPLYLPLPSNSKTALSPIISEQSSPAIPSSPSPGHASISNHYRSIGKKVCQLYLCLEAITPTLWVGEDLLERFQDAEGQDSSDKDGSGQGRVASSSLFAPVSVDSPARGIGGQASLLVSAAESGPRRTSPISPTTPYSATSNASSMDDISLATIATAERSAVTPQLPVLALTSSVGSSCGMGFMGDEERMRTVYSRNGESHY
ncbi:hypothetical protein IAR50_000236 [Cryptococcus sp. DSM 104548]